MLRTAIIVFAGAVAFAAPASDRDRSDDAKLEKKLAGLVAGRPQDCITPSASLSGDHYGNVVLLQDRSGVLYRTSFRGGCTARSTDTLISRRPTNRLCRGDIIEIQDLQAGGIFRGACSYEEFVPYRKPR